MYVGASPTKNSIPRYATFGKRKNY
jgi:hypothetical protein